MLKVVGASWYQTRISTYILIGSGLVMIVVFFFAGMDRPPVDGTYCATVYWSKMSGFKIEYWKQRSDLENIPKGVARTCYKDSIRENGWSQIEIETQRIYPDWVQAFAAGLLEGSLTWMNIYYQWTNTMSSTCDRDEFSQNFCKWLKNTLLTNYVTIKELANTRAPNDHYWHQIQLFQYQLEGLETGWKKGAKRARSGLEDDMSFEDFIFINAAADLNDLELYYQHFVLRKPPNETINLIPTSKIATNFVKSNESWKFLFGHSSSGSYSSMLRMQKRYKFHYHFVEDKKSNTVPGIEVVFTGYPGILGSTDDFYVVKGRQVYSVVAGIPIKNENLKLWTNVDVAQSIPLVARVMAANRLSQSRRTWVRIMSRHPSTGNKQWVLVDMKKLDNFHLPNFKLNYSQMNYDDEINNNKSIVWIVEQLPGQLRAEDVTEYFLTSYFFTDGIPYFEDILEASKVSSKKSVHHSSAKSSITNLNGIEKILKDNAFRGDLLGKQAIPFGNIDLKLFSYDSRFNKSEFFALSGPLFNQATNSNLNDIDNSFLIESMESLVDDDSFQNDHEIMTDRRSIRNDIRAIKVIQHSQGPFKWSQTENSIRNIKHVGHPDEWNFEKISPKWAWCAQNNL